MATILIADDDAGIRRVFSMWLSREGHNVIEVSDGRAAMERLQAREVDLLISDVHMPVLGGVDLVTWWRAEKRPWQPVIIISASGGREVVSTMMGDLDVTFFSKPFSPQELTKTVNELLLGTAEQQAPAQRDQTGFAGGVNDGSIQHRPRSGIEPASPAPGDVPQGG